MSSSFFDSGEPRKQSGAMRPGAAVEVKPVPKTIGVDKLNLEQIR